MGWAGHRGAGDRAPFAFAAVHVHTGREDTATLAENTRGKAYYFPGYNPNNPMDPGNLEPQASPYLRNETLEYTERTTQTIELRGHHKLGDLEWRPQDHFALLTPELGWTASFNEATLYQPDKRMFGSQWWGPYGPPGYVTAGTYYPLKPAENFTLGNLQRVWKDIEENDQQYDVNLKFPFEQWSADKGYSKVGVFYDAVDRTYTQDSFGNFNETGSSYVAPWEDYWSAGLPLGESSDHRRAAVHRRRLRRQAEDCGRVLHDGPAPVVGVQSPRRACATKPPI